MEQIKSKPVVHGTTLHNGEQILESQTFLMSANGRYGAGVYFWHHYPMLMGGRSLGTELALFWIMEKFPSVGTDYCCINANLCINETQDVIDLTSSDAKIMKSNLLYKKRYNDPSEVNLDLVSLFRRERPFAKVIIAEWNIPKDMKSSIFKEDKPIGYVVLDVSIIEDIQMGYKPSARRI